MQKSIIRVLVGTVLLLLVPIMGQLLLDGWNWGPTDFVFAGVAFAVALSLFEWGRSLSKNPVYLLGFGLALGTGFVLFWGNAAVGMIGEDNAVNLLYPLILAVGLLAAILVRFESKAMAKILFAIGLAVATVPVIALLMHVNFQDVPEAANTAQVFLINTGFVILFLGSGLLFRQSRIPLKQVS